MPRARLRAEGTDPAHGGEAGRSRGRRNADHVAANAAWTAERGAEHEPQVFRRVVLPLLQGVSLSTMARATGLSVTYCGLVRRGKKVPHPRHWRAFSHLEVDQMDIEADPFDKE